MLDVLVAAEWSWGGAGGQKLKKGCGKGERHKKSSLSLILSSPLNFFSCFCFLIPSNFFLFSLTSFPLEQACELTPVGYFLPLI